MALAVALGNVLRPVAWNDKGEGDERSEQDGAPSDRAGLPVPRN